MMSHTHTHTHTSDTHTHTHTHARTPICGDNLCHLAARHAAEEQRTPLAQRRLCACMHVQVCLCRVCVAAHAGGETCNGGAGRLAHATAVHARSASTQAAVRAPRERPRPHERHTNALQARVPPTPPARRRAPPSPAPAAATPRAWRACMARSAGGQGGGAAHRGDIGSSRPSGRCMLQVWLPRVCLRAPPRARQPRQRTRSLQPVATKRMSRSRCRCQTAAPLPPAPQHSPDDALVLRPHTHIHPHTHAPAAAASCAPKQHARPPPPLHPPRQARTP
jgi:hypothetical protein